MTLKPISPNGKRKKKIEPIVNNIIIDSDILSEKVEQRKLEIILKENMGEKITIREKEKVPCFRGSIDAKNLSEIEISYNKNYINEFKNNGEENLLRVVEDVLYHEHGHKTICPITLNNHQIILDIIAGVLKDKKKWSESATFDMANAFEDFIDNCKNANQKGITGEVLFYDDVGRHADKYNNFYEAFVKTQMAIYGNKPAKKTLGKYYNHKKEVQEVVSNFLKRSGVSKLTKSVSTKGNKEVIAKDRDKIITYISKPKRWKKLANVFADEFSKLIEPEVPFYGAMMGMGEGESEFSSAMEDDESKMEHVWKRYVGDGEDELDGSPSEFVLAEGNGEEEEKEETDSSSDSTKKGNGTGKGNVFRPPSYLNRFDALDFLYKRLARKLDIKVNANTRSEKMPVVHYGRRVYNPDTDSISRAEFGFNDKCKVELQVPRYSIDIPLHYYEKPESFPEINFVMLDTSGSMTCSPNGSSSDVGKIMNPWDKKEQQFGDKSKYHYALLSWYGLLEFLAKTGNLKRKNVKFANFSDRTYLSEDMDKAKKSAFSPQFGNTNIDMDEINKIFNNKGMLTISLSDGGVQNWSAIKDEFIKRAKQNHYVHIQLGNISTMSSDLANAGIPVYYDTGENLPSIVVDLTRPYFNREEYKK